MFFVSYDFFSLIFLVAYKDTQLTMFWLVVLLARSVDTRSKRTYLQKTMQSSTITSVRNVVTTIKHKKSVDTTFRPREFLTNEVTIKCHVMILRDWIGL